jgi:hypothetical protein
MFSNDTLRLCVLEEEEEAGTRLEEEEDWERQREAGAEPVLPTNSCVGVRSPLVERGEDWEEAAATAAAQASEVRACARCMASLRLCLAPFRWCLMFSNDTERLLTEKEDFDKRPRLEEEEDLRLEEEEDFNLDPSGDSRRSKDFVLFAVGLVLVFSRCHADAERSTSIFAAFAPASSALVAGDPAFQEVDKPLLAPASLSLLLLLALSVVSTWEVRLIPSSGP